MKAKIFLKFAAITIFLVSVCSQTSTASPLQVKVIDSYYHASAHLESSQDWEGNNVIIDNYDRSSSLPFREYWSIGAFTCSADIQNYEFGLSVTTESSGPSPTQRADAEAGAMWDFKPVYDADHLIIRVPYILYFGMVSDFIYLKDLTTSAVLFDRYINDNDILVDILDGQAYVPIMNDFEANHLYRLSFTLTNDSSWDSYDNGLFAYMVAVPEPATILLLITGIIVLAGYGRKKCFNSTTT